MSREACGLTSAVSRVERPRWRLTVDGVCPHVLSIPLVLVLGVGSGDRWRWLPRGLWCHQAGVACRRGPRRPTPSTKGRQEGQDPPYQSGRRHATCR